MENYNDFNQQDPNGYNQNNQYNQYNQVMTKKEFEKHPSVSKIAKEIKICAIVLFVLAGINVLISFASGNLYNILDSALIVGFGVWMLMTKSLASSIVVTAYAAFNMIVMFIATGTPGGYLYLVIGIVAIINTNKLGKAYKEYLASTSAGNYRI